VENDRIKKPEKNDSQVCPFLNLQSKDTRATPTESRNVRLTLLLSVMLEFYMSYQYQVAKK